MVVLRLCSDFVIVTRRNFRVIFGRGRYVYLLCSKQRQLPHHRDKARGSSYQYDATRVLFLILHVRPLGITRIERSRPDLQVPNQSRRNRTRSDPMAPSATSTPSTPVPKDSFVIPVCK